MQLENRCLGEGHTLKGTSAGASNQCIRHCKPSCAPEVQHVASAAEVTSPGQHCFSPLPCSWIEACRTTWCRRMPLTQGAAMPGRLAAASACTSAARRAAQPSAQVSAWEHSQCGPATYCVPLQRDSAAISASPSDLTAFCRRCLLQGLRERGQAGASAGRVDAGGVCGVRPLGERARRVGRHRAGRGQVPGVLWVYLCLCWSCTVGRLLCEISSTADMQVDVDLLLCSG